MAKKYFFVEEDRNFAHREELILANSYDEAYLTYAKDVVKPMTKAQVAIQRVDKEFALSSDAPYPVRPSKKRTFNEKGNQIFYINYNDDKLIFVKAKSYDKAIAKLEKVKNLNKYEIEIRLAGFLWKRDKDKYELIK